MGQNNSSSEKGLVSEVVDVQEELVRHARSFTELATLSHDDLRDHLDQLNTLSQQCMDSDGMQLIFGIEKGTDTSALFWKSRVRIVCVKIDVKKKRVDSYRVMTLYEFLKVFKSLNNQCSLAAQCISSCEEAVEGGEGEGAGAVSSLPLSASLVLREVDRAKSVTGEGKRKAKDDDCCCICFERKPNIMLPCTHSYCMPCIEQWNVNNKTCPICREEMASNDDSWVISEAPNSLEISEEIAASLMEIVANE